jgi:hypothetical protein
MEVIIQVVEDRNYLEAQKGETKTVRMYDLQYAKRHERAQQENRDKASDVAALKKKGIPAALLANDGELPAIDKEQVREMVTFESINEKFVYRGLFNRYVRTLNRTGILQCYEEAGFIIGCPEGHFRDIQAMRLLKTHIAQGSPVPVPVSDELRAELDKCIPVTDTAPLERLRDAMQAELMKDVQGFKRDKRFDLLYDFEVEAARQMEKEDFCQLRLLGRGGFGMVHAVSKTMTGALYAQKACGKMTIINKKRMLTVVNEVDALRRCQHPFIVGLHYVYSDEVNIYIVLDLMLGGKFWWWTFSFVMRE